jgi:hypothetical protein
LVAVFASRRFHSASAANRGYSQQPVTGQGAVSSLEMMETRWKTLEASAGTIRYDSVPWPPRGCVTPAQALA